MGWHLREAAAFPTPDMSTGPWTRPHDGEEAAPPSAEVGWVQPCPVLPPPLPFCQPLGMA